MHNIYLKNSFPEIEIFLCCLFLSFLWQFSVRILQTRHTYNVKERKVGAEGVRVVTPTAHQLSDYNEDALKEKQLEKLPLPFNLQSFLPFSQKAF